MWNQGGRHLPKEGGMDHVEITRPGDKVRKESLRKMGRWGLPSHGRGDRSWELYCVLLGPCRPDWRWLVPLWCAVNPWSVGVLLFGWFFETGSQL